jgi:hypothetical protein
MTIHIGLIGGGNITETHARAAPKKLRAFAANTAVSHIKTLTLS